MHFISARMDYFPFMIWSDLDMKGNARPNEIQPLEDAGYWGGRRKGGGKEEGKSGKGRRGREGTDLEKGQQGVPSPHRRRGSISKG